MAEPPMWKVIVPRAAKRLRGSLEEARAKARIRTGIRAKAKRVPQPNIEVSKGGKTITVRLPRYDKEFARLARQIGGWRNEKGGYWLFPLEVRQEAESLIEARYGKKTIRSKKRRYKKVPRGKVWGKRAQYVPLPRAKGLELYHTSVRPISILHPRLVLLALVYDPPPFYKGYGGKPQLRFFASYTWKAGPLPFFPRHPFVAHEKSLFPLSERFLPEEVEMAVRQGKAATFPLRRLPENTDEAVRRFVETGHVGVCPSCGGPLWGDPFGYLRKVQAVCLGCGRAVEKDWGG